MLAIFTGQLTGGNEIVRNMIILYHQTKCILEGIDTWRNAKSYFGKELLFSLKLLLKSFLYIKKSLALAWIQPQGGLLLSMV